MSHPPRGALVRLSSLWLVGNKNDNYCVKPSVLFFCVIGCWQCVMLLIPGWWWWGRRGGQWKIAGTLWISHSWSGRALTPFELWRAPSPPGRLRAGAVRAETAGCCSRLSWKAETPCFECWTPPCLWASRELWSWSSDRSGDKGGQANWETGTSQSIQCSTSSCVSACSCVSDFPAILRR